MLVADKEEVQPQQFTAGAQHTPRFLLLQRWSAPSWSYVVVSYAIRAWGVFVRKKLH